MSNFQGILMTTSDLSGCCKPFGVSKAIAESVYEEFYDQVSNDIPHITVEGTWESSVKIIYFIDKLCGFNLDSSMVKQN